MDSNLEFEKLKRKHRRLTTIFILFLLCIAAFIGYTIYQRNLPKPTITLEEYNDSLLFKQTSLTLDEVIHSEELLNFYSICEASDKVSREELVVDLPNRRIYNKDRDVCLGYYNKF